MLTKDFNPWKNMDEFDPKQFADIDITAKTNEVTKMFLGVEMADEIFAYPSSFGGYQKIDTAAFFN